MAYAFGASRTILTLLNGCTLLTTPVAVMPATLNARGRYLLTLNVPASVLGSVEVQGFAVRPDAGFPASDRKRLHMPPGVGREIDTDQKAILIVLDSLI